MSLVSLTSRATAPAEDAGELAEVSVLDLEGEEVRLGDLWREQPAVLAFLRHYG